MHPQKLLAINSILILDLILTSALLIGNTFGAPVQITSLPFSITSPGTYILTSNLTFSAPAISNVGAITISPATSGPVVLNLKGFTITGVGGQNNNVGVLIGFTPQVPNVASITIESGAINGFGFGVWAENDETLTSISVDHITFAMAGTPGGGGAGVLFSQTQLSSITNCTFNAGDGGIHDFQSPGGNRFTNCTFVGVNPLFITGPNGGPVLLEHYHVEAPQ